MVHRKKWTEKNHTTLACIWTNKRVWLYYDFRAVCLMLVQEFMQWYTSMNWNTFTIYSRTIFFCYSVFMAEQRQIHDNKLPPVHNATVHSFFFEMRPTLLLHAILCDFSCLWFPLCVLPIFFSIKTHCLLACSGMKTVIIGALMVVIIIQQSINTLSRQTYTCFVLVQNC